MITKKRNPSQSNLTNVIQNNDDNLFPLTTTQSNLTITSSSSQTQSSSSASTSSGNKRRRQTSVKTFKSKKKRLS